MTMRNEYPRPQFVRESWTNLNGTWGFAFDDADQGLDRRWQESAEPFNTAIEVPFVYQSKLSGIGARDRHDVVWYRREFETGPVGDDHRVLLHFGAVDYEATVFVNGNQVARHEGGNTPFSADITPYLNADGPQILTVRVHDPQHDEQVPRGKQYWLDHSESIWYTNSTGIWQTVWLETVPESRLDGVRFTPRYDEGKVTVTCESVGVRAGDRLRYRIAMDGEIYAQGELVWASDVLDWDVDLVQRHVFRTGFHGQHEIDWTPEHPHLFDVDLMLVDAAGVEIDRVSSYFGFRKVHTEHGMVYLNNKPYYQKLVLDQGYWPDGLLTAPADADFRTDIELAKAMGFNGCRKHQKMEDPRFLYWADRLGYIVWGECASAPVYTQRAVDRLMREWAEVVDRDYNHPCILVWVPLNESWGVPHIHSDRVQQHCSQAMYHYLHAIDPTRLVESNDGWEQTETDICAIHNYTHGQAGDHEQYEEYRRSLATRDDLLSHAPAGWDIYARGFENRGEPILLTEFGGIGFDVSGEPGWGYTSASDAEEFLSDYGRIMDAVYASHGLWGYCYTQLCDVEQEINGLLTYEREPKCDPARIKAINDRWHTAKVSL